MERSPENSDNQHSRRVFTKEINTVYQESGHGFRLFNQEYQESEQPLLVHLEIGATALDSMGLGRLYQYAQDIPRPLITVDPPGYGLSETKPGRGIYDLSSEYIEVMKGFGFHSWDTAGTSYGAVIAGAMALMANDGDIERLVTVSHPVTRRSLAHYLPSLPAEAFNIVRDMRRMRQLQAAGDVRDIGPSSLVSARLLRTNIGLARLAMQGKLEHLQELPPSIAWSDIIGERDRLSKATDHAEIVAAREALFPGVSKLRMISDHGHTWAPWDRRLHNELVRDALGVSE